MEISSLREHWATFRSTLAGVLLCVVLPGCQVGYYGQAVKGHWSLMGKREPVADVLNDASTSPELADQLRFSQQVIAFAGEALSLPAEDVYHQYVALEQDAVVWNVLAAPAYSLTPKTWCYLMIGCVSYRGYFDKDRATREADALAEDGMDTFVGGAIAYSTLGWFADPLTTPMLERSRPSLAQLLIHELVHRKVYIKDDTRFNESLATLVGREGAVDYFAHSGEPLSAAYWQQREQVQDAFMAIVQATRAALKELYASAQDADALAREKTRILQQARDRFARDSQAQPALKAYAGFFDGRLNNARLNGVSDYNDYVPAFARLLDQCQRDWGCFWQQVDNLVALTLAQRTDALEGLAWN
ncbi:hypothetical protein A3754_12510 [Alcanivorax sp. HI0083]|nr:MULTISPECIES: aminopeptidase [unclassified Alcanivorax]KZY38321.1 hypothetical protein A3730_10555 [Alcanivorax sp. HI0044]KZZ26071.1 hypothetical protein A3754_12510 [Alcanivorax sp. HI0083]